MTIFGAIWLLLIVITLSKNNIKNMVFLTLLSMVFQCSNVFCIGDITVGPQVITNIAFIFMYILKNFSSKMKKASKTEICALILYIVVIISSIYNGTLISQFLRIVQLGVYMISFSLMIRLRDEIDEEFIYKSLRIITIFVLIIGIIQLLSTSGIIPRIPIISQFIFNDQSENVYYWRDSYKRLTSVFMEPSYCACFLIGAFYYFISSWKEGRKNILLILFLLIEIFLTKSSTAYVALIICGVFFVIFSKNKKLKKILIPTAILAGIVALVFFYDTLDAVIFSKGSSGSANTRHYWNINALNKYEESKLLGAGYNSLRASSIVYSLLGELGILGLMAYTILNLNICLPLVKKTTYNDFSNEGIRFAILAIVIAQIIACPDLDLCVYWLFMYFVALYGLKGVSMQDKTVEENNECLKENQVL